MNRMKNKMKLKNIMIVVTNIDKSVDFYRELFGLQVILNGDKNAILTEGLVLQEKEEWEENIGGIIKTNSKSFELYFEERNVDRFKDKLKRLYPDIKFMNDLTTYSNGKQIIRFCDLDGHIIEVGTKLID